MAKKSVFINNIKAQNDLGCYCWGANGEKASELKDVRIFIYNHETSDSNAKTTYNLYVKRKANKELRFMDCSGTIVYGLRSSGAKASTFDTTAEGLRTKYCTPIEKQELREGDLCFKMSDGEATHVGMYVGNNKVIESRGRKWGVVTRSITLGGWKRYGRLKIQWDDEPKQYVLTRILKKGCEGSDVKELQKKLISLGFSVGSRGADGEFGSKTKDGVVAFQRKNPVACGKGVIKNYDDGKVGQRTCEALGWIWRG